MPSEVIRATRPALQEPYRTMRLPSKFASYIYTSNVCGTISLTSLLNFSVDICNIFLDF